MALDRFFDAPLRMRLAADAADDVRRDPKLTDEERKRRLAKLEDEYDAAWFDRHRFDDER